MNEKQSIGIIEDMIHTAKQEHSSGPAFFFVLWGIIVMVFSILTFWAVQTHAGWQPVTYSIFAVGGIISILKSKREDSMEKSKSRDESLYMFVWSGVGACLALTWFFAPVLGVNNILPVSLMLYAFASFITGGVTKYYPSLVGAVICFVCVIFAFNLNFAYQNLVCAMAVLFVHVIPGLMMKGYYKRRNYAQ